jgi:hypothetical protein
LTSGAKSARLMSVRVIGLCLVLALSFTMVFAGCKRSSDQEEEEPIVEEPSEEEIFLWPYTGMEAENEEVIKNRPLSVKIENSAAARPQMGINQADIVYETMVEGGETRLNCIYQSNIPDEVGPVRSARLSDLWIAPQYQGLFLYAGGNDEFKAGLKASDIANMSYSIASKIFYRVNFRSAPHNLYLSLSKAYDAAKDLGIETQSDTLIPWNFLELSREENEDSTTDAAVEDTTGSALSNATEDVVATAGAVTVSYAGYSAARWDWDEASKSYLRSQGGKIHTDSDDERVTATNVVVLFAEYTQRSALDPAGHPTYDIALGGTGKAMLFKGGYKYDCTWTAERDKPPVLTNSEGRKIPLYPGRTWVEVPTLSTSVTVE